MFVLVLTFLLLRVWRGIRVRIQASDLAFASHNSLFQAQEKEETVNAWHGLRRPNFQADRHQLNAHKPVYARLPAEKVLNRPDKVTLSQDALAQRTKTKSLSNPASQQASSVDDSPLQTLDSKTDLLKQMVEMLTGRKIDVLNVSEMDIESEQSSQVTQSESLVETTLTGRRGLKGSSQEYQFHESVYEKQTLDIEAKGTIITADGQKFDFDLDLEMSREYSSETDIQIASSKLSHKQPLLFNYGGQASELSDFVFDFHLDLEVENKLPGLGRGYLVLDKNHDGKLDNENSLFSEGSPQSSISSLGDDESQTLDSLQILSYDFKLNFQMQSLSSIKIGALYNKVMESPFVPKQGVKPVSEDQMMLDENPRIADPLANKSIPSNVLPAQLPQAPKPLAQGLI